MAIVRNILVRVGADINPMQKNLSKAQKSLNGFSSEQKKALYSMNANMKTLMGGAGASTAGITKSLNITKAAVAGLAIAATAAFAIVGKKSIESAMNVIESENLFEISMGNMADAARQWSNDLSASLGLNAYEVRKNVGLFYNMTTSLGVAQDQAYDLSTGLTQLAYDMSSFYNIPYEDMFVKLQAGISGEIEPLRRLGIIVNETNTQNYAYANGIANVGAELTESQKVLARYGVIMESTANAQGDLARTIDSPTNQLRIFKTQLELASINLGNAFMPLVEAVLPLLVEFARDLAAVTNTFAQFTRALFGANSAQAQNATSAAKAAAAQTNLGKATKAAGDAAKKGVAGFDEINQLQEDLAQNGDGATDGVSTTPTPTKPDQGDSGAISQGVLDMANKAKEALQPVGDYLSEIRGLFKSFWANIQPALQPIVDFIVKIFKPVWEGIKTTVRNVFDVLKDIIKGALQVIQGVFEVFAGLLTGDWDMLWQGIKDIFIGAWEIIKALLVGVWTEISIIWTTALGVLDVVWETVWTSIQNFAVGIWESIKATAITAWTGISTFFTTIWNAIKTTATTVWTAISVFFSTLWNSIKTTAITIWDNIKTALSNSWNWLSSKAGEVANGVKDKLITAFTIIRDVVASIWEGIKTSTKGSINFLIGAINKFIRGVNSIKITIPEVDIPLVGKVGGGTIGFPQIPTIPMLAKGAIVSSPTLAMIGEAGKEAVVPLENTSFVDSIASAIGTAVLNAMQFSQQSNNQTQPSQAMFFLDGSQFARAIIPLIDTEMSRQGPMAIQGV